MNSKEKKAIRTSIRQPLPKKSKIKENEINDEDYAVPLTIFFTTDSQPTVTCNTPYNCSVTPLASLDHSYCMNEENMSLSSYLDLSDEIKAFKIENSILKDKIKASKEPIKVLVQRRNKNEVLYCNCIISFI